MSKHKNIIKSNKNSLFFVNNNYKYKANLTENNKRFKYIRQYNKTIEVRKKQKKISRGAPSLYSIPDSSTSLVT